MIQINRALRRGRVAGQGQMLESNLARVIAAFLIAAVLAAYFFSSGQTKTQTAQSQVNTIATTVESTYGNQGDYTGLTSAQIAGTGQLPSAWVSGAAGAQTITSVFHTPIALAPATNTAQFTLEVDGVPQANCTQLATMSMGATEVGVTVDGTASAGASMTSDEATKACTAGPHKMIYTMQ